MPGQATAFVSRSLWQGQLILVHSTEPCPIVGHALEVMHHIDEDGRHYCPTGFLWCPYCAGVADEPEPHACARWGE